MTGRSLVGLETLEKAISTSCVAARAVKTPVSSAPYPLMCSGSHPPAETSIPLPVLWERIWTRYLCPGVRSFSFSVIVGVFVQHQALPSIKPKAVFETSSFPRFPLWWA